MSQEWRHDLRMEMASQSLAMQDALADDDVLNALERFIESAEECYERMHGHGVGAVTTTGFLVGAILKAGMSDE